LAFFNSLKNNKSSQLLGYFYQLNILVWLQHPQNTLFLKVQANTYYLCKPRHFPSVFLVLSSASKATKHSILASPSQHLLFVQTQPLPGIFPYCTRDMERLRVDEFCNLSKLTNVSMKEKNWTLSSGLGAKQCEHELALTENNGVVDIVETPQLNPYEQARAQCIAELQAQLAPLERQAAEL
jgi:hypothetical protein